MSVRPPFFKEEVLPHEIADVSRPLPPFDRPPEPRPQSRRVVKALLVALAAGVIAGCAAGGASVAPSVTHGAPRDGANISRALPAASPTPFPADQAGCGPGPASGASCGVTKNPNHPASKTPSGGLSPAQLRAAYGLPAASTAGVPAGPTIAIVVAFDSPSAEQDLGTYRSQFGLPACTTPNGCFLKVTIKPTPGDPPPAPAPPPHSADGTTWSDERALDLAMASAACPNCRLLLVEAAGEDLDSLANAVNVAASYGPAAISNSWGVPEGGGNVPNIDSGAQSAFNHPGIAITASAGDLGVGAVQFPASSPYVTSVGGTTLTADAGAARGWDEAAWSGSGNGCSIMVALPSWQGAAAPCNGSRSVPDISMLADSSIGAAVYSTAEKGWVVLGGTSLGAPFVAGLYAAAADYGAGTVGAPNIYANLAQFNVVPGTNGSPNGLAGF
jgi:subtilase family serine protease